MKVLVYFYTALSFFFFYNMSDAESSRILFVLGGHWVCVCVCVLSLFLFVLCFEGDGKNIFIGLGLCVNTCIVTVQIGFTVSSVPLADQCDD